MKRVAKGAKENGNGISWDEALDTIANNSSIIKEITGLSQSVMIGMIFLSANGLELESPIGAFIQRMVWPNRNDGLWAVTSRRPSG